MLSIIFNTCACELWDGIFCLFHVLSLLSVERKNSMNSATLLFLDSALLLTSPKKHTAVIAHRNTRDVMAHYTLVTTDSWNTDVKLCSVLPI